MSSAQTSEAFWNLHRRLQVIVEQQIQAGNVRALPLSPVQLARAAEESAEFKDFVVDLFDVGDMSEYVEEIDEDSEDFAQLKRDVKIETLSDALSELLKRSGYYHALTTLLSRARLNLLNIIRPFQNVSSQRKGKSSNFS